MKAKQPSQSGAKAKPAHADPRDSSLESMTGYGEARATVGGVMLHCRAKSVNHRFLDVKLRLPRGELLGLDAAVRKRTAEIFKRGALEVTVSIEASSSTGDTVINAAVAAERWKELQALSKKLGKGKKSAALEPSLDSLMRLPGVIGQTSGENELLTSEHEPELLAKVVEPALQQLKSSRLTEGGRLATHLLGLLDEMDAHVEEIRKLEGPEKERGRQLMMDRAQETLKLLTGLGPNVSTEEFAVRLREEAVFWIERRDFDEERMRLAMHLKDFRAQITNPGELSGRKLEFIQQEILREINTLGTKAQSPAITTRTIELKTILERVREQLANVA